MHLLERYATSCGVKIGKPHIYDNFFPLPIEKYICFQPFSKYPSKNYDLWQEVLDIIVPYLDKNNIKIIQIGVKDDRQFNNAVYLSGQTNISQAAYIVKNSILHFGADSFGAHIASGYGKKIVAIYSNNNIENVKPYWSKDEDIILIKPQDGTVRPSYSAGENPKNINKIKPEEIAKSVLNLLNIKYTRIPKTVYIGEDFLNKTFEVILDQLINPDSIPVPNPIIRMDYFFNEQGLEIFLQKKKCIILTNAPININLLKNYKQNIGQIIYFIESNCDVNFIKNLKKNNIPYALASYLTESELNKYKIDLMDLGLIHQRKNNERIDLNNYNNLYYNSSRIIVSSEGQFGSKFEWKNKSGKKIVDHPDFWKESNNFYIFSIDE